MKRTFAVIAAVIVCFAIGSAVATALVKKHVSSTITLAISSTPPSPYNPAGTGTYSGDVNSRKHKCVVDRTVVIKRNGATIGNTHTDDNGHYAFNTTAVPDPGTYTAKAKKKSFKNKRHTKIIVCDPATSNSVTVP